MDDEPISPVIKIRLGGLTMLRPNPDFVANHPHQMNPDGPRLWGPPGKQKPYDPATDASDDEDYDPTVETFNDYSSLEWLRRPHNAFRT